MLFVVPFISAFFGGVVILIAGLHKGTTAFNMTLSGFKLAGTLVLLVACRSALSRATAYLSRPGAWKSRPLVRRVSHSELQSGITDLPPEGEWRARRLLAWILVAGAVLATFTLQWHPNTAQGHVTDQLTSTPTLASIVIALLMGASAGISEELWRAISLRLFGARTRPAGAVLTTGIVFGLLHISWQGLALDAIHVLAATAIGITFGAMMVYGVPVRVLMIVHATYDAILLTVHKSQITLSEFTKQSGKAGYELVDVAMMLPIIIFFAVCAVVAWRRMMAAHRAGYPAIDAAA